MEAANATEEPRLYELVSARTERARQGCATYSTEEAAAILGCSVTTVKVMCREGRVPHIRLGNRNRFPKQAFTDWLTEAARRNGGYGE